MNCGCNNALKLKIQYEEIDNQSNSRFSYFGNDDEDFFTQSLNGYVPASVGIKAVDFSGKLKIELNRTF